MTSLGHVTDEFDQTSVEKCFLLSSRDQSEIAMDQTGSTAIQSVQIYFKIPKFVSHVQILAPNYPNGECWLLAVAEEPAWHFGLKMVSIWKTKQEYMCDAI